MCNVEFGASLQIRTSSSTTGSRMLDYQVPPLFQTNSDAREAVAFHSFLEGSLDTLSAWLDFPTATITSSLYNAAVERIKARISIRTMCDDFGVELPRVEYEDVGTPESELIHARLRDNQA